ncbi:PAS domain-containing protein [Streptomyces zhihengii]
MLHGLATQSPLGLAIYDTDLCLTWANAAHDQEVGRPLAEYRGRPAEQLYPDGAFQTVTGPRTLNEVMRRVIDSGESFLDLHFLAKLPSDPRRDHLWSCSYYRLQDDDGTVLGVCEDAFDITDRHEAQHRLSLLAEAGRRIGITLDVADTAQAIADVAVPDFADSVTVDVLRAAVEGGEPLHGPAAGRDLIRVAARSGPSGEDAGPQARGRDDGAERAVVYPEGSPQLRSLSSGGRVLDDTTLVVPLRSGGRTMGLVSYRRAAAPDLRRRRGRARRRADRPRRPRHRQRPPLHPRTHRSAHPPAGAAAAVPPAAVGGRRRPPVPARRRPHRRGRRLVRRHPALRGAGRPRRR